MARFQQPILPRPSPEPENNPNDQSFQQQQPRGLALLNTSFSHGLPFGDFHPGVSVDQWSTYVTQTQGHSHHSFHAQQSYDAQQGLDAQQNFDAQHGFQATQAFDSSQGLTATNGFDTMQGHYTSQSMDDPHGFQAQQALATSQAMTGSWGGFAQPAQQSFHDPFAMSYGLNGTSYNAARASASSDEPELPSPMTAVPIGRNFSNDSLGYHQFPANPAYENHVRPSIEQDGRFQQHPDNTGVGQPEQNRVSEESRNASSQSLQSAQGNRVAIPQLSVQPLQAQPPSIAPAMGPLSRTVAVPARPKPGRKPLPQEDAQDRRRVQNRLAQRNFRDKRAQKVSELTADNDQLRRDMDNLIKKHSNAMEGQRQETNRLKRKLETLEKDLEAANKRSEDAENKLHSFDSLKRFKAAGFPNPVLQTTTTSASLPSITTNWRGPVSDYAANNQNVITPPQEEWPETDMTSLWTPRNPPRQETNANEDNGTQWLGSGMDIDSREDDNCGFCTDLENCSCFQSRRAIQQTKATKTIAPGGCDACIADPARADACRALAAKTDFSSSTPADQRNDSMLPPPAPSTQVSSSQASSSQAPSGQASMMNCSNFIDRVQTQGLGQRVPSISELFGGISHSIHSYPSSSAAGTGYDVNEHEAAQVLQDMSRRPSVKSAKSAKSAQSPPS